MIISRRTVSLCPTCLKEIPALVRVSNQDVRMFKRCPEHGEYEGLIEKDPIFYMFCANLDDGEIYDGLFIDVTEKCNTSCRYCYHSCGKGEPTAEEIVTECAEHADLAPFILLGGEPTVRDDLPELLRAINEIGQVILVTNGLKLADPEYMRSLDALILKDANVYNASISLHPESHNAPGDYALKLQAIENVITAGMRLYGLIFVIDELSQIEEALTINRMFGGGIMETRIKIASEIGKTNDGCDSIFNSDVYEYLQRRSIEEGVSFEINTSVHNKLAYFNMIYDGIRLATVKWYSRHNVDLMDINCGPWHRNKDGRYLNMGHSLILGG